MLTQYFVHVISICMLDILFSQHNGRPLHHFCPCGLLSSLCIEVIPRNVFVDWDLQLK